MDKVIADSKHLDYAKIVQVGDFGLWDHLANGVKFLDDTNEKLRLHGRKMFALGGNHENWDHWNWYLANGPKTVDGFTMIRSHIFLIPRVHGWRWYDKRFYAVAGAASIDKQERLEREKNGEPKQWWWQEQITDAEIDEIPQLKREYLFTHDCSNRTPWGFQLVPDFDSQIHRQRIDRALERTLPKMHFHGHMHKRYEWVNRVGGDNWTDTFGLDCNGNKNSWGILDTEHNTFTFNR